MFRKALISLVVAAAWTAPASASEGAKADAARMAMKAFESCAVSKMILRGKAASIDELVQAAASGCSQEEQLVGATFADALREEDPTFDRNDESIAAATSAGNLMERANKLAAEYKSGD